MYKEVFALFVSIPNQICKSFRLLIIVMREQDKDGDGQSAYLPLAYF